MVIVCSKCGKKLGSFSIQHKLENNSVMCNFCFKKWKSGQGEKDKKIMLDYISKYIPDKDFELNGCILGLYKKHFSGLYKNKDAIYAIFDEDSFEKIKEHYHSLLQEVKSSSKSGLSSYEIDDIISTTELYENVLYFLDDLEKMYKLFKKKGIETNYFEIMSLFAELAGNNLEKEYDKILNPAYKIISKRLGEDTSIERVIKEFMKIPSIDDDDYDVGIISRLIDKFDLDYQKEELKEIIEKIKEEIDLEEFEQNLGSSQKIDIGNFTKLKGYEFEDYLKDLFKLLGYGVIRTSLSGDQGADLIVSKDSEKTVIQVKKCSGKVSNRAIQEIVAAKNHYRAEKAIVITNSMFTKSAIDLSLSNDVELWDGAKLRNIIKNLKTKRQKGKIERVCTLKKGKDIQKIKILCPFCEQEFDCKVREVDMRKGINFKTECPHCGASVINSVK